MNILIVDDEDYILEQSKYYLNKINDEFDISTTSSAEEGLVLIEEGSYDLIVSDYQMPDMDGLDFLKKINDKKLDIPFIMFTGRGREEVAIQALNLGADRYIQKGGDPLSQYEVLARVIEKTIEHKNTERAVEERRKKIEALHKIAFEMENCRSEQEVYELTVEAAENILDFFVCSVLIHENDKMVLKATRDTRVEIGSEFSTDYGICGLTYREREPFLIHDLDEHDQAEPSDPEFRSVLSIPMGDIGVFQALSREYDSFDENDLDIAKLLIAHTREAVKRIRYDRARRQSEKRYRHIVENSLDVIYSADLDGTITYVGPQIRRLGYEPSELIGESISKFIIEEDKRMIEDIFFKAIDTGEEKEEKVTFRFIKKNGDIAHLEENTNIIKEKGKPVEVTGVLRDVTERVEVKQKLKEGKEEYENLFENSPVGLWNEDYSLVKERMEELTEKVDDLENYLDENEDVLHDFMSLVKIKDVNKKAVEIYNAEGKEELFDSFGKIYTNFSLDIFKKILMKISKGEKFFSEEDLNKTLDGEPINILFTWSVVPGHEDTYDKVYVSTQDITDKIKTERMLKHSQKRFQTLYENIPGGTLIIGEDYRIIDVNDRTCEITGFSKEELIGELCDIICPKGSKSTKCPILAKGANGFKGMDTQIKCKDDTRTPILKNAKRLQIEDDLYIMENFQDIEEKKRSENKILKEKEKIEKLHRIANEFEKCKSEDKVYSLIMEASENILGFDKLCSIEVVEDDQVYLIAISKEDESVYEQQPLSESGYVKKTYENKESYIINDALGDEDAEPVRSKYRSGISIPIDDKGVFQAVAFKKDVFDEEDIRLGELLISHAEEALKRINSEERLKFLHSLLRHDLRNKNQVVRGYIKLIERENIPEDDIELLNKVEKNAEEGIELIEKIRILSELEEEEIRSVEIGKTIEQVVENIFSEEYSEDFMIEMDDIDHLVRGGPLLNELFSNIITNSIIHSKGSLISISAEEHDDLLMISVEDDGEGIKKGYEERIFEKGFSIGESSGSGLGLYLVKKITEFYGGNIHASSSELGGTKFDIKLKSVQ